MQLEAGCKLQAALEDSTFEGKEKLSLTGDTAEIIWRRFGMVAFEEFDVSKLQLKFTRKWVTV